MLQYLNLLEPRKPNPKPKPSALLKLGYKDLVLDEYESGWRSATSPCSFTDKLYFSQTGQIASEVIHPDDIDVHFDGMSSMPLVSKGSCKSYLLRHWRSRTHHTLIAGVRHLPFAISQPVQRFLNGCPERCLALRTTRMRQDNVGKSASEGIWRHIHQHRSLCHNQQMVWRLEQAHCCTILTGTQNATEHRVH